MRSRHARSRRYAPFLLLPGIINMLALVVPIMFTACLGEAVTSLIEGMVLNEQVISPTSLSASCLSGLLNKASGRAVMQNSGRSVTLQIAGGVGI